MSVQFLDVGIEPAYVHSIGSDVGRKNYSDRLAHPVSPRRGGDSHPLDHAVRRSILPPSGGFANARRHRVADDRAACGADLPRSDPRPGFSRLHAAAIPRADRRRRESTPSGPTDGAGRCTTQPWGRLGTRAFHSSALVHAIASDLGKHPARSAGQNVSAVFKNSASSRAS